MLGSPAPAGSGQRDIELAPGQRSVNVTGGETVNFHSAGRLFSWTFDVGANVYSFGLQEVAPAGWVSDALTVYIATDPRYIAAP